MSDFLERLIARSLQAAELVQPRPASRFESPLGPEPRAVPDAHAPPADEPEAHADPANAPPRPAPPPPAPPPQLQTSAPPGPLGSPARGPALPAPAVVRPAPPTSPEPASAPRVPVHSATPTAPPVPEPAAVPEPMAPPRRPRQRGGEVGVQRAVGGAPPLRALVPAPGEVPRPAPAPDPVGHGQTVPPTPGTPELSLPAMVRRMVLQPPAREVVREHRVERTLRVETHVEPAPVAQTASRDAPPTARPRPDPAREPRDLRPRSAAPPPVLVPNTEPRPVSAGTPPPAAGPAIQVTIGRVEVRATAGDPAPPRPRPQAEVMGLDEYLAQRAGGRGG